jgi:hypothetical protein
MNLVSNTKTLIFDDKYDEIINLRDALDQEKIQSLYIKFDEPDEIKDEDKFTNVRFIFADILVGSARTGGKGDVSAIITSISEHLSKKNGVFILIIWSNHNSELSDELIHELQNEEGYSFFPIKSISKSKYTKKIENKIERKKLLEELIDELKNELKENTEYFNLLRIWERDIHTAASETFNILLDDLNNKDRTHSLLKNAVIASAGTKQNTDAISKRKNLWNTLNMVLNDNVESQLHSLAIKPEITCILDGLEKKTKISTNELINKKLLFSTTSKTDLKMHPGNIFCFESYISACDSLKEKVCGYKNNEVLVDEILDDELFNKYIDKYKEDNKLTRKDGTAFRVSTKLKFIPILLEFTPYCDFSQKGYKKSRLIFGHLIPIELRSYIYGNSKYLYTTPNFELEHAIEHIPIGKYFLTLNIKHIFSVNPEFLNHFSLLFRARKELVNDIQHDIANHISRVGVTSLV